MSLEDQRAEALRDLRLRSVRRINFLRVAGILAFTVSIAATVHLGMDPVLLPTVIYLAIALVFLVAGRLSPRVLWASRFAIPVFDMPMVFIIQMHHLLGTEPEAWGCVSEFSVSLFVCLILLSAFTLNRGQLLVSLVLAILFEQVLQYRAGVSSGAHMSSAIVLCFVTWICFYAGRNRLRLAEEVVEADARRRRLQRYFWPGVGKLLEERDEEDLALGRERELTVLFADIREFTALSEHLSGRGVIALLNEYHARMVDAVFEHEGTLDKYLGDGLMVYFNAPIEQPDHAWRAVQCAAEMERGLVALNARDTREGEKPLRMGIGIHTGRAIVGDIGAPHRREFTAIGLAVNVAARLEEMTKDLGVAMLVSEATAIRVGDGVAFDEVGFHRVRGCAEPLRLLTPRAAG